MNNSLEEWRAALCSLPSNSIFEIFQVGCRDGAGTDWRQEGPHYVVRAVGVEPSVARVLHRGRGALRRQHQRQSGGSHQLHHDGRRSGEWLLNF